MKKNLAVLTALLLALAVAMPALAAVEFKYGGQFRARWDSSDNIYDGTNSTGEFQTANHNAGGPLTHHSDDDNRNFIDQRLRLYFSFIASQNLKVVTKFEMGDTTWGDSNPIGGTTGSKYSAGGRVGADAVNVELKNAYVEFNIPCTPTTAIVGIQTLTLLDSWIVDDDFSAAVLVTKLDPFKITVGYVGGQNGGVSIAGDMPWTDPSRNVDSFLMSLDYKQGPWAGALVFFYQNAHNTAASIDPNTLWTPESLWGNADPNFFPNGYNTESNQLFDLGINVSYKIDWLSAYINFVKNFGSVDIVDPAALPGVSSKVFSSDYTGWMIDGGVSYYCGPYTLNVGGFYTTGQEFNKNNPGRDWANSFGTVDQKSKDVNWFTYPLATAKYFSEIIGGGVLGDDRYAYRGFADGTNLTGTSTMRTVYWRGYGFPTNLWTVTAGGAWQVAEKTKISASYWYFGTAEEVPVSFNVRRNRYDFSSSIGHEIDLYVDQGIVDGLNLTLVGAYLIANDAFAPVPATNSAQYTKNLADNAYELGARLQWNF